ncbi:pilus assembly protein PilP [Pseudomonas putida]|uniref:pilus assembly protein PilP n=1 Tax=Pseudomonas putida TaxID=303 RepID=UPI0024E11A76|nr:pilus assembly protein PilP [Pseudomonas putida]HDS0964165.1 pilus assembly protein PilP [Pseudomonas putida]HDS0989749.1 pilus assembly protein PilP [Pseudomonas putida]
MVTWLAVAESSSRIRCIAPVLVAVLVFGMGCALRLPAGLQQQAQETTRQASLGEQRSVSAAKLVELEQLQAARVVAEQALKVAHWRLANGEDMSDLLDSLASSGHAHGLLVEQLDVHETEQQAGYRKTPLQVQVVGPYVALRQWLHDWLGQARLLRSGDMSLAAVAGQPGLLRLQLRVEAFQAAAPVPAPDVLARTPARAATPEPMVDPFAPAARRMAGSGLASVPLAQLEMVGSLSRGTSHEALLMAAGRLYRVRAGEPLGRNHGVVERIDQGRVEVRERLFMAGEWHERTAFITLAKRLGKEAPDRNENVDEMGVGSLAADPAGVGDAFPG